MTSLSLVQVVLSKILFITNISVILTIVLLLKLPENDGIRSKDALL